MNHDSYSDDYIRGILHASRSFAIVGASANTVRPSYFVVKYLMDKEYQVIPVNPGLAGKDLLVSPHAVRVLNRLGVMGRVYSESGARKQLEQLVGDDEQFGFQSLLAQHGDEVCLPKSPHCGECGVIDLCSFKRKVGVALA